jgi:hypothetical protein
LLKNHQDKDISLPKSYQLRMVMLWLKQDKYGRGHPESKVAFIRDVLDRAMEFFLAGNLPNFFDPRVNLLLGVKEKERLLVCNKLFDVKDNLLDHVRSCSGKKMCFSSFLLGALREYYRGLQSRGLRRVDFLESCLDELAGGYKGRRREPEWERRLSMEVLREVFEHAVQRDHARVMEVTMSLSPTLEQILFAGEAVAAVYGTDEHIGAVMEKFWRDHTQALGTGRVGHCLPIANAGATALLLLRLL